MPTILRVRGYRIGFFQADLAASRGFRPHEIREIATILEEYKEQLMAAWDAEEAKRGDGACENPDG